MNQRLAVIGIGAVVLLGFGACASYEASAPPTSTSSADWGGAEAPEAEEALSDGISGYGGGKGAARQEAKASPAGPALVSRGEGGDLDGALDDAEGEPAPDEAKDGQAADVRQWFPEAFLWAPLVETDASGKAVVPVRVPDSLTTWRVLALAHSRDGDQAGAVHTFDSRLDLYVDPVVPGWLYAGDAVELPIQVVNTTDAAVSAELVVTSTGSLAGNGRDAIRLGAYDSDVRKVLLETTGAGPARVKAVLGTSDAAEREIPVSPAGRPVSSARGGTLSGPRTFHLAGPEGADPSTQALSVRVFPGPLAVLQAEVERAGSGGATPAEAAYGFELAHQLQVLSEKSGIDADPKAVRRLQLLAWQRVVTYSRSADAGTATDLLLGMGAVSGHELAEELAARLVDTVAAGQRADGTWARQSSASLQKVIVQTALSARTLPADEEGARLRASGAIERYARDVVDPYTAAVVLASGLVDGDTATFLRETLDKGVVTHADGSKTVTVPSGVSDPWGNRPTKAQVLAWTALATDDAVLRGDLVSELMGGWSASWGFGAGPADAIALEAVVTALPGLDQVVEVALTLDGVEVARQKLDPAQPKVPALLIAAPRGADPELGLTVTPAVPGLAFVAALDSWVPWTGAESMAGVEVEATLEPLRVGVDGDLVLTLAAPSGVALVVEQGLPAGASVDEADLVAAGLSDVEVRTDRVRFRTKSFAAGEVLEVTLPVRAAFAGSFSTVPLTIGVVGSAAEPVALRPLVWQVEG